MPAVIRSFISLSLPENIISFIRGLQNQLKTYNFHIKWVEPENIHLTVKFLGNIEKNKIETVKQAIMQTAVSQKAVSLKAKGLGVFPTIKQPKVVWMGLAGNTHFLINLHQELDKNLEAAGFEKDKRFLKAHITLGRIKGKIDSRKLLEAVTELGLLESEEFAINKIKMYKSDLKPAGPVYTELMSGYLNEPNFDTKKR